MSFSTAPASVPEGAKEGDTNLFVAPDFAVATAEGVVVTVQAGCFEEPARFEPGHTVVVEVCVGIPVNVHAVT